MLRPRIYVVAPRPRRPVPPDGAKKTPERGGFFGRAVLFLVFLVGVDLWCSHHLGVGVSDPGWLAPLFAAVSGAAAWLDRLLAKPEQEALAGRVRKLAAPVLATPTLLILYLTALIAASSLSSVMVVGSSGRGVELGYASASDASGAGLGQTFRQVGNPPRFLVPTSLFGRPYRLNVPGYLPTTVEVPPFAGLRVVPERDLQSSPSVLLRPPFAALASLGRCKDPENRKDCGFIVIWTTVDGKRVDLARSEGSRSSFLVGRPRPLPAGLFSDWRMELLGLGYRESDDQLWQTLLEWKRMKHLDLEVELEPGMVLEAEVQSKSKKRKAHARVTIGRSEFVDVLMDEE